MSDDAPPAAPAPERRGVPKPAYPKPSAAAASSPAASPAAPAARRAPRRGLAACLLAAGVAGVALSLSPWSLSAVAAVCPYIAARAGGGAAAWALGALPPAWVDALGLSAWAAAGASRGPRFGPPPARGFSTAGGVDARTGLPVFSADELRAHDGSVPGRRLLLGFNGVVYDVTDRGSVFYGPGAAYALFAGRDSTRALALGTLEAADVARGGDVADFVDDERYLALLREQEAFYAGKYPAVGVILGHRLEAGPAPAPAATPAPAGEGGEAATAGAPDEGAARAPAPADG